MLSLENRFNKITFDNKTFVLLSKEMDNKATLNTSKSIGQNGVYLNNSYLEGRDITLKVAILGRGNSIELPKKNLINLINPLEKLVLRDNGYRIECVATSTLKINYSTMKRDYVECLIELFCPNPFFNNEEDNVVDLSYWIDNFSFELEIPEDGIEFGYKGEESITNLYNKSTIETGIIITIKANGTIINPSILNIYTREYIKINKTLNPGEVVTINTNYGQKRIEINNNGTVKNILNLMDIGSTFLQLHPGDNWFKLESDSGTDNITCQIKYNDKILGV